MYEASCMLQKPQFRSGIEFHILKSKIEINYGEQGCIIEVPSVHREELYQALKLLQTNGLPINTLSEKFPILGKEISTLILQLDNMGFLTGTQFNSTKGISGRQLYTEIIRFVERLKPRVVQSLFFKRLLDKSITYNELVGYACEYYHVVKLAPGLIGPALSNIETQKTSKILQKFLMSEMYHDKMLEKSLKAVGFSPEQLELLQPLPTTFAICATLGVLAKQHPLSFKAALFLFEQPYPEFNDAFVERCQALDMPKEFYKPIIDHSTINEEGEHDDITRVLLEDVGYVSPEDAREVKKNTAAIIEFMADQDRELVDYYSNSDNTIPRVW